MRRRVLTAVAIAAALTTTVAACGGGPGGGGGKITDDKIVLGVLNDQSGVYSELSGKNSVTAVEMAVEDFKAKYGDDAITKNIEVVTADHQNKPDVANTKAQELYDRQKADVILDVPTSSAALAVAGQAAAKKKLHINVTAATTELTGAKCNKYTFHWAYDTYMLANGTGTSVTEAGAKDWYIVYPDYAFGQDMQKSFTEAIQKTGGQVITADPTPFPNDDFSTFLLKAPTLSPTPSVIGTMHAGGDLVNLVKQYNEFGLREKGVDLSVGLMFITDIHSLGVEAFAGTTFTDAWYWNADADNRAWADRFQAKTGTRPSFAHAGNYSAALQYLEAAQRAGTDNADDVVKALEGFAFNDVFAANGQVRAEDHRMIHDSYLAKVKSPDQVTEDWDYEEIVETIPAAEAFRPAAESGCQF
ncbi:ABC transporter substrate-binding protein [Phytomonospora endophytica]|uniref:Branched-chain amino acid transport system substrate-binding protein n=1 Tax=Phytomonospora endophytica TaxID=714109 RepID=A0A841FL37_9ACTN|nr:ABC transporter substrate-binding protein [Phytomonospora endophytica]MBB6036876.1 branched-chain amino acid transport system substrate-binding protein [Phytomonospora endophytica]GIG68090.1 ABC transporter permease [Phytomonospora endophytica]